jgi:hypothetical protein
MVAELNQGKGWWNQADKYSWDAGSDEVQDARADLAGTKGPSPEKLYQQYLQTQGKYAKKIGNQMSPLEFKQFLKDGRVRIAGGEKRYLSPEQKKYRKSIVAWRPTLQPGDIIDAALLAEVAQEIPPFGVPSYY